MRGAWRRRWGTSCWGTSSRTCCATKSCNRISSRAGRITIIIITHIRLWLPSSCSYYCSPATTAAAPTPPSRRRRRHQYSSSHKSRRAARLLFSSCYTRVDEQQKIWEQQALPVRCRLLLLLRGVSEAGGAPSAAATGPPPSSSAARAAPHARLLLAVVGRPLILRRHPGTAGASAAACWRRRIG